MADLSTSHRNRSLRQFADSFRMPPSAAITYIGVPALVGIALAILYAIHKPIGVNYILYPVLVLVYALWIFPIFVFMVSSFRRSQSAQPHVPATRFVCIIPAYNEEAVIRNPIASLQMQHYPKDLYEIWVVCDGTDRTKDVALECGVNVIETPIKGAGKYKALAHAIEQIIEPGDCRYVCIFDADNVAGPKYLASMNDAIQTFGHKCLQGFHAVLNHSHNWVTKGLWCATNASSALYLGGRMAALRNTLICGTGWCIEASLLHSKWPRIRTQTEDIELNGILAIEEGIRVAFVPQAVFYDEKPMSLWIAIRQRMRWMCGHMRVCYYYFWKCLGNGISARNLAAIELAMYYTTPFIFLASFASVPIMIGTALHVFVVTGILANRVLEGSLSAVALFFMFGYQALGFASCDTKSATRYEHWRRVGVYSIYAACFSVLVWPPAVVWALFCLAKDEWLFHTPHVSAVLPPPSAEIVDMSSRDIVRLTLGTKVSSSVGLQREMSASDILESA